MLNNQYFKADCMYIHEIVYVLCKIRDCDECSNSHHTYSIIDVIVVSIIILLTPTNLALRYSTPSKHFILYLLVLVVWKQLLLATRPPKLLHLNCNCLANVSNKWLVFMYLFLTLIVLKFPTLTYHNISPCGETPYFIVKRVKVA